MNHKETFHPGVGRTAEFDLRVSVATLVRVLFEHPKDGDSMLALERKATLYKTKNRRVIEVKAQPFGGVVQIYDLDLMQRSVGDFNFDSEYSSDQQDFRLFIRSSAWKTVREFCIQHIERVNDPVFETEPTRELAEEFGDALKISLKQSQYHYKPIATVVEDHPSPTENISAAGIPTVRVYRIFEAWITDASLAHAMLENSNYLSDQDLRAMAEDDDKNGGEGRANALLVLPLKRVIAAYLGVSPPERNVPILFEGHRLDETVTTILDGVAAPKYQRL